MYEPPDWSRAHAVIFDVDGTLYDAARLRRRMLVALVAHCLADPRRLSDLRTLHLYRREREKLAEAESTDILRRQYERPARLLGLAPREVEAIVQQWIHQRPLPYLRQCRVDGAGQFFDWIRSSGGTVAVLSDYPAKAKLDALDLAADVIVCGTDPDVNRLKPHPGGLEALLRRLDVHPSDCILVGDRDSRDGEVARRAGVPYVLRRRDNRLSGRTFSDFIELLARASRTRPRDS